LEQESKMQKSCSSALGSGRSSEVMDAQYGAYVRMKESKPRALAFGPGRPTPMQAALAPAIEVERPDRAGGNGPRSGHCGCWGFRIRVRHGSLIFQARRLTELAPAGPGCPVVAGGSSGRSLSPS